MYGKKIATRIFRLSLCYANMHEKYIVPRLIFMEKYRCVNQASDMGQHV